jgi:hypothetical protein
MSETAPDPHHAVLVARLAVLRRILDDETAARARAEAERDDARDLAGLFRDRAELLEADRDRLRGRLRSRLRSRLLTQAPWAALGGLAGGMLLVVALKLVGL